MTSNNHIEYSVVIPVYNSAECLRELYDRLQSVFKQMNKSFEVVFVNDCSRDNSLNILQEIHSQYNNIIVADLYTNFGQQNTLMCGFQYCQGRYIITMDDDLQNPPEEIQKLIEKLNEGYDAVFGTYTDKKDKFYKNWGSVLFRKLNHKIFNLSNNFSGFSLFPLIAMGSLFLKVILTLVFLFGALSGETVLWKIYSGAKFFGFSKTFPSVDV